MRALQAPHAIQPEDGEVGDRTKPAESDAGHSSPVRPQKSSQVRAKTITDMGPGRLKSAQPNPNVWAKHHADSNIDGPPSSDPPMDPVFATR